MAKLKYWDQELNQWVALDQKNADQLGGINADQYQLKTEVQQVSNKVGDLTQLETSVKTDIVNALNSVYQNVQQIDLTDLIDDTAGNGTVDKVWSADKVFNELKSKVTDKLGVANGIATLDANGLVLASQISKEYKETKVVADIAARDAIPVEDLYESLFVYVLDASDDPSVTAGAALYIYAEDPENVGSYIWHKVAELESLDVELQWTSILGRPTSTPAQIDQQVADSHTHSNKSVLDKLNEAVSGNLMYDGQEYVPFSRYQQDLTIYDNKFLMLEGDETVEGSVANAEYNAKIYTDTKVAPKADKVVSATANNLAALTSDGNLVDSGLPKSNVMMVHIGTTAPVDTSYFWVDLNE